MRSSRSVESCLDGKHETYAPPTNSLCGTKEDEINLALRKEKQSMAWFFLFLFVLSAGIDGMNALPESKSIKSYEENIGLFAFGWFVCWILATRLFEFPFRLNRLDAKVSAIEKAVTDALVVAPASLHEYLAEQAAWKAIERLDGRTDDRAETKYNPESHDLVVKGIKCVEVGKDYESGYSVPQNPELAEAWFRRAVQWYELAAKKGDSYAQEKLGDFWAEGKGVRRDDAKALYWWCESAHRGRASAQYRLGEKFYFGNYVEKNLAEALFWFHVVIMSHPAGFTELKRQAALYRDDAAQHLTPAELTQAQERARKWFEDHPAKPQ